MKTIKHKAKVSYMGIGISCFKVLTIKTIRREIKVLTLLNCNKSDRCESYGSH